MKVFAPGKLILSGEHAVVHGHPALAMAVNRYAMTTATPHFLPFISFDLSDLAYQDRLSLSALRHLKNRIKEKYQRFLHGDFKIRDVLQKPVELAQFALTLFFEMINIKLTQGIKISVQSDIPIGCGMGSSAATVLSIVHAIAHHLHIPLSEDVLFRLGLEAENMQHGFSSGLDLRVSLQGGCLYMQEGKIISRDIPRVPLYLINTGSPAMGTGECVTAVTNHFKTSSIGNDFSDVTNAMDSALQQNNIVDVANAIRANHRLLVNIGVVPQPVQQFITEIEAHQGAAKICGAGATHGDKAGVVLAVSEDVSSLQKVCEKHHFELIPVTCETRGVHVV